MKKFIIAVTVLAVMFNCAYAREEVPRRLLRNTLDGITDKAETFKAGSRWMPYPEYSDRAGWDALTGKYKAGLIKKGEKALKQEWKLITASEYLEFEKDGKVSHTYSTKANFAKISTLTVAELAEGKGRFLPDLLDGLFYMAERASWQSPFHQRGRMKSKRTLPDPEERYISLNSADAGSRIAEALYFFKDEFDRIDPSISRTILQSLRKNIYEPYLNAEKDRIGHSWLGYGAAKGGMVNNWNTYCNMQSLMAFLLVDDSQDEIDRALEKCCWSMDNYLDYVSLDGACEEGPSYWNMAGAKVFDFASMMNYASGGKFNVLKDEQVRRMCSYKADAYIGDSWVVNFADGLAKENCNGHLMFRMGRETGDLNLENFGLLLLSDRGKGRFENTNHLLEGTFRTLEALRFMGEVEKAEEAIMAECGSDFDKVCTRLTNSLTSNWYPTTQIATLRNGNGWVLAAKGGHNNESHNHNDVGSAILFIDDCPVFIDMGCGLYSLKTFLDDTRYTLDENRSDWHNLPTVNGSLQNHGRNYAAANTNCDPAACRFSCDIAAAYDGQSSCRKWIRSYRLDKTSLTILDEYELGERKAADDIHFVTPGEVEIKGGAVLIHTKSSGGDRHVTVRISCPKGMKASVELKNISDERHHRVWGDKLYRIVFTSRDKAPLKGVYATKFEVE